MGKKVLPKDGYPKPSLALAFPVDLLRKDQVDRINKDLDWHAFTTDGHGRRVGSIHSTKKRAEPQNLVDTRIIQLNDLSTLYEKKVIEFGCFEGIHSLALSSFGARVTAVDARPINLAKTALRAGLYGYAVHPLLLDLDDINQLTKASSTGLLNHDVLVHIGVLYHLSNPVDHLRVVLPQIKETVLLDTHVSRSAKEIKREFGFRDPFSGVNDKSTWISQETIHELLLEFGFSNILDEEFRDERNGLRWRTVRTRGASRNENFENQN